MHHFFLFCYGVATVLGKFREWHNVPSIDGAYLVFYTNMKHAYNIALEKIAVRKISYLEQTFELPTDIKPN